MRSIAVSRYIQAPLEEVYEHFTSPSEDKRLDLHSNHVRRYRELDRGPDHLEYEFVFQAFGMRFYGAGREDFVHPESSILEVSRGVIRGTRIELRFEPEEDGTRVTQITEIPPRVLGLIQHLFGRLVDARIRGITAVHLDEHKRDLEGLKQGTHNTSGRARRLSPADALGLTRPVSLPLVLLPLLAGALVAPGPVAALALTLTLVGGSAALLAGNLSNDIWDFSDGADHAADAMPDAVLTGSGVLLDGRITVGTAWRIVAALVATAVLCGAALTPDHLWVPAFAVSGLLVALAYQAPRLRASYRGWGLGELCIWAAFGPIPVLGATYVQSGAIDPPAGILGAVFGLGAALVVYCHHFLHWQADRTAGKRSPVAVLGPRVAATLGFAFTLIYGACTTAALSTLGAPTPTMVTAALAPLLPLLPLWRFATETGAPAWGLLISAYLSYLVCSGTLLWAL